MKAKTKMIVLTLGLLLFLGTFAKIFTDPFHQKTEKVCFWEWLGKEIWELIYGEV